MFRTGAPFANIPANMQMKYMQIMQIYDELSGDMRRLYSDFSCDASGNRVVVLSGPRVRIPPTPPSHPNTLDQWAKSPVISTVSPHRYTMCHGGTVGTGKSKTQTQMHEFASCFLHKGRACQEQCRRSEFSGAS